MDLAVIERWQHSKDVELFYNSSARTIVFKKYSFVYSKGVDDLISQPYIDLDHYGTPHLFSVFAPSGTVLAFSRSLSAIVSSK